MEAPSGSFLPRCPECNDKRWKQFMNSKSEQLGRTSRGVNTPFDEYYSCYDDYDDYHWG